MISFTYLVHIQEIAYCFCMFSFSIITSNNLFSTYCQLKFESYHPYMTGQPEQIMLLEDVSNSKSLKLLGLLAGLFLPASTRNILWKLKEVFPVPIRQIFFQCKLVKPTKHPIPAELMPNANHGYIISEDEKF